MWREHTGLLTDLGGLVCAYLADEDAMRMDVMFSDIACLRRRTQYVTLESIFADNVSYALERFVNTAFGDSDWDDLQWWMWRRRTVLTGDWATMAARVITEVKERPPCVTSASDMECAYEMASVLSSSVRHTTAGDCPGRRAAPLDGMHLSGRRARTSHRAENIVGRLAPQTGRPSDSSPRRNSCLSVSSTRHRATTTTIGPNRYVRRNSGLCRGDHRLWHRHSGSTPGCGLTFIVPIRLRWPTAKFAWTLRR